MQQVDFFTVGRYEGVYENGRRMKGQMKVTINSKWKNALVRLNQFSHCLLFTKDEKRIYCYFAQIMGADENKGEMTFALKEDSDGIQGDLVDIKPYFPCEENAGTGPDFCTGFTPVAFKGEPVGEYLHFKHDGVIRLRETGSLSCNEMEVMLGNIKAGCYMRVLWWFHKFDDKKYRSHAMCNPPYENAPRCGVFATRSPVRPNPLASTVVKVGAVDKYNHSITVLGFDGMEHTPILQIMPYETHVFHDVTVPEWVAHWTDHIVFTDNTGMEAFIEETQEHGKEEDSFFIPELETDEGAETADTNEIVVENASIHNLKDISARIPKGKITAITGVSGSGKSSLAFDTIYHESQRQFMDLVASNSPVGNDLADSMVGRISGLQPSIAIEQRNLGQNPRSTVASVTRTGDFLRLLFATVGERICPNCNLPVPNNHVCSRCGTIYFKMTPSLFNYNHPEYMCPVCKGLGEEMEIDPDLIVENPDASILDGASAWWGDLRKHREKPNANWMKGEVLALADEMGEDLEVPFRELSESFKTQLFYGSCGREVSLHYENPNGRSGIITRPVEGVINILHRLLADSSPDQSIAHIERFIVNKKCSRCNGERLLAEGRLVRIGTTRYPVAAGMCISELKKWCHAIYAQFDAVQREKSKGILKKLIGRLTKLEQVGLGYLSLDRSIPSLSGGESQRVKIASQFGSGLSNILYIMDEPSKGLHSHDYRFLMGTIRDLKKKNNTVIMVEHKKAFVEMADFVLEIGPGAGRYGGELLRAEKVQGKDSADMDDLQYPVAGNEIEAERRLTLQGAKTNNLKNIDVTFPLGSFICVVGVSGSGKSSLVSKTLYPALLKRLGKKVISNEDYSGIAGTERVRDVFFVSQRAIGKNARSNPGTYTGVFDLIRSFYAGLADAKEQKLTREHFSFNSAKGQCEECRGVGEITVPMHFMPDVYTVCTKCNGRRYRDNVLTVKYKGFSIADVLEMEISEVKELFKTEEKIYRILDMLDKVGLSYVKLGQSAATLSGGEAQRIKLAKELCDGKTKDAVYLLDEPTSGLHDQDIKRLERIFHELTQKGATVIVIEHNPLLIRESDYLIEMGPTGGAEGGYLLRAGWLDKEKSGGPA